MMLCKLQLKKTTLFLVLALGVVSFAYGLLTFLFATPEGRAANTLLGMFTGFGFGIIAVAIFRLIRERVTPKEKLEQEMIEKQDERNVAIIRAAGLVGMYAAGALLVILTFVFMGLGYRVPSFICVGGLYVVLGAFLIARHILSKRM